MRVASSASWHAIKAVVLAIIRTENGVASTDAGSGTIQIHVPCSMMHHGHERRRRTSHGAILYVWMCGRARSGGRVGRRGCSSHVMSHVARRSRSWTVEGGSASGGQRRDAPRARIIMDTWSNRPIGQDFFGLLPKNFSPMVFVMSPNLYSSLPVNAETAFLVRSPNS